MAQQHSLRGHMNGQRQSIDEMELRFLISKVIGRPLKPQEWPRIQPNGDVLVNDAANGSYLIKLKAEIVKL